MRLMAVTLIGILMCTVQTRADDLPSRKPGLWEVRQIIGNAKSSPLMIKQCIDAATDHMLHRVPVLIRPISARPVTCRNPRMG